MSVVVVGAGIVGAMAAWDLALAGAEVSVVDPAPGSGASHAAAGMLGAASEAWFGHDELRAACTDSLQKWPAVRARLAQRTGAQLPWCEAGTLLVAAEPGDAADLRRLLGLLRSHDVAATALTGQDAAVREPALTPRVAGAVHLDEPAVDPRAVVAALLADLGVLGVQVIAEAAVAVEPGRPAAVRLVGGRRLEADHVLVAAGVATGALEGVPAEALGGLHSVKGQILRLAPGVEAGSGAVGAPPLRHVVRGQVAGRAIYAVPYGDGRVAVGATSEDRDDLAVTAGAVHRLLDDALRLVPGLAELGLLETTARVRPMTESGLPVVAEVAPGVIVATGHGRHGVLLAPGAAAAVSALVGAGVPAAGERAPSRLVVVNGEPTPLPDAPTIVALLAQVAPEFPGGRGLAVAVDAEVVPRERWDAVVLRGGEHVEVLTAIQGG